MYTYMQSLALSRAYGSEWSHPDLTDVTLKVIFSDYTKVFLKVFNSYTEEEVYIDMDAYRTEHAVSETTIRFWLASMEGKPLAIIDKPPQYSLTTARYANSIQRGYKYDLGKIGFPYPVNMPIEELHDLKVTRPSYNTDMSLLHTHCLNTVNGFFHRTDTDGKVFWIIDGGKTAMKERCTHTGVLSFLDIGRIKQVGLARENIVPLSDEDVLSEGLLIRLNEDLVGKSVMFFLGGYLVKEEPEVFFKVGDNTWCLNIRGLPYYERLIESVTRIDLSSLDLKTPDTSIDNAFFEKDALKDETILAYLTISQTFFAIIDTPEIYYNKVNVRTSNIPGMITAYQEPEAPLFMGYGRMMEYSKVDETDYWALRVADEWYVQYAWQTADNSSRQQLTNQYLTWKPYLRSQAHMLEIKAKKA